MVGGFVVCFCNDMCFIRKNILFRFDSKVLSTLIYCNITTMTMRTAGQIVLELSRSQNSKQWNNCRLKIQKSKESTAAYRCAKVSTHCAFFVKK